METSLQFTSRKAELKERIKALEGERDSLERDVSFLKDRLEIIDLERYSSSLDGEIVSLRVEKTLLEEKLASTSSMSQMKEPSGEEAVVQTIRAELAPEQKQQHAEQFHEDEQSEQNQEDFGAMSPRTDDEFAPEPAAIPEQGSVQTIEVVVASAAESSEEPKTFLADSVPSSDSTPSSSSSEVVASPQE